MSNNNLLDKLQTALPNISFEAELPLAPFTTVKIGGPAEVFCRVKSQTDLINLLKFVISEQIPYMMLGSGSNTLISDKGIRGLVIKNEVTGFEIKDQLPAQPMPNLGLTRWQSTASLDSSPSTSLDNLERIRVEIEAGTVLGLAINKLLNQGVTGLEWFVRIPGTIGGAVVNNVHGGNYYFGQFIESVKVIDKQGKLKELTAQELEFDYDYSRFHKSGEIIISVNLLLFNGNVEKAKEVVKDWANKKAHQPQTTLGCTFQNLSTDQQQKLNLPTPSIGYLVEEVLGLKGKQIGGARISPMHCAFIENTGNATAQDYLELIKLISSQTQSKFGITLKPEIFFTGFTKQELSGINS